MHKIWLGLLLLLVGCSASGANFNPDHHAKFTELVIYRPSSVIYISKKFPIAINGEDTCNLSNAGFARIPITPNKTNITSSLWGMPGTSSLTLDASDHKTHYVKIEGGSGVMGAAILGFVGALASEGINGSGPFELTEVSREQALMDLKDLKADCE